MPVDITKVIVGYASIFYAPAGTPMPDDDTSVGVDWPTPWVNVGATEEGLSQIVGSDTADIRVEEQSTPAAVLQTAKNIRLEFAASEDTLETMKLAFGSGTITTIAATATSPALKKLNLSDSFDKLAVGFEALGSAGFYRRAYYPTVLSVADVTTVYRRAENNRSYAVSLRYVGPTDAIDITEKTANHT